MNHREELLSRALAMPALPSSAVQVIQILQDADSDMGTVVNALELDPGLTANVLKLANSSLLGASSPVDSIRNAIVRLGFDRILQLVLTSTVRGVSSAEIKGYDVGPGELWRHSVAVALAADMATEVLGLPRNRAAFTAGILHDIGRIVLGSVSEDGAEDVMELAFRENLSFEIAERAVLGIDHAELGAAVLESWGLPSPVVEVVRWHHHPPRAERASALVDLIHIADHVATIAGIGLGREGLQYCLDEAAAKRVGLTPEYADTIVFRTLSAFDNLADMFEVDNVGSKAG